MAARIFPVSSPCLVKSKLGCLQQVGPRIPSMHRLRGAGPLLHRWLRHGPYRQQAVRLPASMNSFDQVYNTGSALCPPCGIARRCCHHRAVIVLAHPPDGLRSYIQHDAYLVLCREMLAGRTAYVLDHPLGGLFCAGVFWFHASFLRHYDETKTLFKSQHQFGDIGADGEQFTLVRFYVGCAPNNSRCPA